MLDHFHHIYCQYQPNGSALSSLQLQCCNAFLYLSYTRTIMFYNVLLENFIYFFPSCKVSSNFKVYDD